MVLLLHLQLQWPQLLLLHLRRQFMVLLLQWPQLLARQQWRGSNAPTSCPVGIQ